MRLADTTNDPTNMAALYVASYRFMQAVNKTRPAKAVRMASAPKTTTAEVAVVDDDAPVRFDALRRVRASLRKFCNPVMDPPDTPHAKR